MILKNFKKLFSLAIFFSISFFVFAIPLNNIKEYTLENGLTVFILQDTSTPLIRMEYTARAGFSFQTKETSGFFKLYTRLFESSANGINFDSVECNADSSRYIITTTPSQFETTIQTLAKTAFDIEYSNQVLSDELSKLKLEVKEDATSAGGFINAAIDSKVFSQFPWKHDSGVYPALFNQTTSAKARNILNTISSRYYTPQNSALFISGNINENTILSLINDTFGHYYSSYSIPSTKKSIPVNSQRKYVLHSNDFSADMVQVVMQYTMLNIEECDLAATMFNNDNSFFKYNLVNQPVLNIPGNEYVNASAAHKKDSSRMIIQSLLQKPEGKNASSVTSLDQVQTFVDCVTNGIKDTNFIEFYIAQQQSISNMNIINSSSTDFMENLSAYWAIQPFDSFNEEVFDNNSSLTAQNLFSRTDKLSQITLEQIVSKCSAEEPFIFVIINSTDFKKNKAKYIQAGFEEINSSNAAWYNQSAYKNYEDPESSLAQLDDLYANQTANGQNTSYFNDFYQQNINQIKKTLLSNNIPLTTKYNENSSDITILLSIQGGKLKSAKNNGFEEVMINILAQNIEKEISRQQQEAIILGSPVIDWNCNITSSTISIECSPYDFNACSKAISNAIIYGEIIPSQADRAVSNRQYKKRLENGSVSTQMICSAIREVYSKSDLSKIFDEKNEVLQKTSYQEILEAYPDLLDASRYQIIVTGLFPEDIVSTMNSTMGLLSSMNKKTNYVSLKSNLKGNSKKNIKLTHTFLTDIPAEKAGPMPAKLIPTTEFLDPVVYVFNIPEYGTKENAVANAAFMYLEKLVQKQIDMNPKLSSAKAQANEFRATTDITTFAILNVSNQKEMDAAFRNAVLNFQSLLNSENVNSVIREIKDNWINTQLSLTLTNTGTAMLLQKGAEYFPYEQNPEYYLNEYLFIENATREDFLKALESIPGQPHLRFYAK